jgi:hypothetical protein
VHVVSALRKTSKVNTILKEVIFKHSVILFRCSMICRYPEPWNVKTSHFRISYSIPSRISDLFYLIRKHMTPFYWQQKLPDNREYIKIQEWLLKQSYLQTNIKLAILWKFQSSYEWRVNTVNRYIGKSIIVNRGGCSEEHPWCTRNTHAWPEYKPHSR